MDIASQVNEMQEKLLIIKQLSHKINDWLGNMVKFGIVIVEDFAPLMTSSQEKRSAPKFVISIHSSVQSRNTSVMDKLGRLCCALKLWDVAKLGYDIIGASWPETILFQESDIISHDWAVGCDKPERYNMLPVDWISMPEL